MYLPSACREEAESLVKHFNNSFQHLDFDFLDHPDGFIIKIAAYGNVRQPGEMEAALCRLGTHTTRLSQFRVITSARNDYIFMGKDPDVNMAEQIAYKMDQVSSHLHEYSTHQQEQLDQMLNRLLYPVSRRSGTNGG
jgi:hypothetical protein